MTFTKMKSDIDELRRGQSTILKLLQDNTHSMLQLQSAAQNCEDLLSTEAKSEQSTPTNAFDAAPVQPNLADNDKQSEAKVDTIDEKVETKDDDNVELAGGRPFEDHIDAKIDISACELELKHQLPMYKFFFANSPKHLKMIMPPNTLPPEYPERLLGCGATGFPTFENATLSGLSVEDLNGAPVRIKKFIESKQRYQVQIIDPEAAEPRHLLVERDKIDVFPLKDISEAYSDFEEHARATPTLLSLLTEKPSDVGTIGAFLDFQLPPIANPKDWDTDCGWKDVYYYISNWCCNYGLSVTKEECPLILSFLYCFCYDRFDHIWKKYMIPPT